MNALMWAVNLVLCIMFLTVALATGLYGMALIWAVAIVACGLAFIGSVTDR